VIVGCPEGVELAARLRGQQDLTPHQRCLALMRWAFGVYAQLPEVARTVSTLASDMMWFMSGCVWCTKVQNFMYTTSALLFCVEGLLDLCTLCCLAWRCGVWKVQSLSHATPGLLDADALGVWCVCTTARGARTVSTLALDMCFGAAFLFQSLQTTYAGSSAIWGFILIPSCYTIPLLRWLASSANTLWCEML
jgi:hypothetical protein